MDVINLLVSIVAAIAAWLAIPNLRQRKVFVPLILAVVFGWAPIASIRTSSHTGLRDSGVTILLRSGSTRKVGT
jgi:hypothetical protein